MDDRFPPRRVGPSMNRQRVIVLMTVAVFFVLLFP